MKEKSKHQIIEVTNNLHKRKIVINIDGNCVPQNNKTDLHNNKNRDTVVSNSQRA